MIKIEKNRSYSFNLMPNFHDLPRMTERLEYASQDRPAILASKYFSYVLHNGEIDVLIYGKAIFDLISNYLSGYYTNHNNDFISKIPIDEYLMNDEGDIIFDAYTLETDKEGLIEDGYKLYTDIIHEGPINPFDINGGLKLEFSTIDNQGFMQIIGVRFVEGEPIYKEGDDKSTIIKLYDNTIHLNDVVEDHKKELNKKHKFLFGDDAKKARYENYKKQNV